MKLLCGLRCQGHDRIAAADFEPERKAADAACAAIIIAARTGLTRPPALKLLVDLAGGIEPKRSPPETEHYNETGNDEKRPAAAARFR